MMARGMAAGVIGGTVAAATGGNFDKLAGKPIWTLER